MRLMGPQPSLLSTGDAEREFGVTAASLRRWAKAGRVRHVVMPSGRLRFFREDIEALFRVVEPTANPTAVPAQEPASAAQPKTPAGARRRVRKSA